MARTTKTVRRRTTAYARASRRKTARWSAKNKATSTHKTFRGIGRLVRSVFGTGKKAGHKQYRYK